MLGPALGLLLAAAPHPVPVSFAIAPDALEGCKADAVEAAFRKRLGKSRLLRPAGAQTAPLLQLEVLECVVLAEATRTTDERRVPIVVPLPHGRADGAESSLGVTYKSDRTVVLRARLGRSSRFVEVGSAGTRHRLADAVDDIVRGLDRALGADPELLAPVASPSPLK